MGGVEGTGMAFGAEILGTEKGEAGAALAVIELVGQG